MGSKRVVTFYHWGNLQCFRSAPLNRSAFHRSATRTAGSSLPSRFSHNCGGWEGEIFTLE